MSATAAIANAVNESPTRPSSEGATTRSGHEPWSSIAATPTLSAARLRERAAATAGRAVVFDEETSSRRQLCGELAAGGWAVTTVHELDGLRAAIAPRDGTPGPDLPDLIVAEYRLAGKSVLDLLACVPPSLWPRLVIVTAYGSVASAVRAVKLGVAGYLVKPARADHVLHAAGYDATSPDDAPPSYVSLDRAIWEVLNEAVEQAGTVSGAARRLGLHARSLRRMLAKYPPAR
jgi:two-component system response regulator RegA